MVLAVKTACVTEGTFSARSEQIEVEPTKDLQGSTVAEQTCACAQSYKMASLATGLVASDRNVAIVVRMRAVSFLALVASCIAG